MTARPRTLPSASLRTGSLRARTVVAVLVLLALLLVALCVAVQAVLGERLRTQIEDRLRDRASAAAALVGTVDADDLADRLSAQGLSVRITAADGDSVQAGPSPEQLRQGPPDPGGLPGPAGRPGGSAASGTSAPGSDGAGSGAAASGSGSAGSGAAASGSGAAASGSGPSTARVTVRSSTLHEDGRIVTLVSRLSDGSTIRLTAGTASVDEVLGELRWVMLGASTGFLLLAGAGLVLVVRRTMRPLDEMTAAARSIARGDRGRRLRPRRRDTEIGRVALAFDEMLDAVEGAERQALAAEARMRAFLSDAAHELRTPVAGIRAAADTLVRAPIDDTAGSSGVTGSSDVTASSGPGGGAVDRQDLAVHVVRQAGRAARLVDDMLLMARVDRGLELATSGVDLCAVARLEAERACLRAPDLDVRVTAPDGPVVVTADADRLGQVLANLLENASRATAGVGTVELDVSWSGDADGVVSVRDDGPGVPEPDRERVFERLVRLDDGRDDRSGGAGLGLPIARGIARAHGGDLVCPPGPTTVFVLSVPVGTVPASEGRPAATLVAT